MKLIDIISENDADIRRYKIDFEDILFSDFTNPHLNIHRYIDSQNVFTHYAMSHLTDDGANFIRNLQKIPGIDNINIHFNRISRNKVLFDIEKSEKFSWNFITKSIIYVIQNDLPSLYNLINLHKIVNHSFNDNIFNTSYLKSDIDTLTISSGRSFLKYPYLNLRRIRCGVHRPSCKFFMMEGNVVINVNNCFTRYGLDVCKKLYSHEKFDGEIIYFNCSNHKLTLHFVNHNHIDNIGLVETTNILRDIGIKNPLFS